MLLRLVESHDVDRTAPQFAFEVLADDSDLIRWSGLLVVDRGTRCESLQQVRRSLPQGQCAASGAEGQSETADRQSGLLPSVA